MAEDQEEKRREALSAKRMEKQLKADASRKPETLYRPEMFARKRPGKKEEKKEPLFLSVTRWGGRAFRGMGKGAKYSPEQEDSLNFLDWQVSAEDYYATFKGLFLYGTIAGVLAGLVMALASEVNTGLFAGLSIVLAAIVAANLYMQLPKMAAEQEKKLALAYIPEIVNYIVMSMRLVPNLEKAVEFAASHGRGKIAEDMKRIIWQVQIGEYESVEEALDELAYRWGPYSDDFKHALMLIRSSLIETDKQRRDDLLEKANSDVLEGSKEKMDLYARQLHQPTVYLYYFGILLPLMMAIILPIGGAIAKTDIANPVTMSVLYIFILPVLVLVYGNSILGSRPPTYVPPDIPEDFPGLPPKGIWRIGNTGVPYKFLAVFLFAGLVAAGYWADQQLLASIPSYALEEQMKIVPHITVFCDKAGAKCDPFIGQLTVSGLLLGIAAAVSVWLLGKYSARKKVQDEIRAMEVEFKDALYVLASRLGENRPMEEALRQAVEFLPKSKIANNIFKRILENVSSMGMTVEAAIFDETFGAIKNYPSNVIRGGLRIMVDSVELGVNVAAKSLISLSMQIRNAQKIDEMLRKLLEDVTTMLGTMSTFVAPIVLAVVASLQKVITTSLTGNCPEAAAETASVPGMSGTTGLSGMFCGGAKGADPTTFSLILGIYVIEIVVLLTYFNSQIEDSNNRLHTYTSVAVALPIAVVLYVVISYVTASFLAGTAA